MTGIRRFLAHSLAIATVSGLSIIGFAPSANAVTHIDTVFDCAAIETSSLNIPKFWAQAGDTVTVKFRN